MRNIIIKNKADKVLSKGGESASYSIYISLGVAFIVNLVLANSLKFIFKNIAKIQFVGFMVFLNIELPFMIQDLFSFFNLNKHVNGDMYLISN